MRKLAKFAAGTAAAASAVACVAAATGFPRRVGLTRSEAALSLPGDLLLPVAPVQADRAHTFRSSRSAGAGESALWSHLLELGDLYALVWNQPLELVYDRSGEALVWRTVPGNGAFAATLAVLLIPQADGEVAVRLRERYKPHDKAGLRASRTMTVATALVTSGSWLQLRGALDA